MPCHNSGSCFPSAIDGPDAQPVCHCPLNFTGTLCEEKLNPCVHSSCSGGSHCQPLPVGGGFSCVCPKDSDALCNQQSGEVWEFWGDSYLRLPRLEGVSRAFSAEIWFLSRSPQGILLYDGQAFPSATQATPATLHVKGDFIAITLVDGRPVFTFNLGATPARITTNETVDLGQWQVVRVSRLDREGYLQLNNGTVYRATSGGHLSELNLELPLYIGGLPKNSDELNLEEGNTSGGGLGLVGAVQRVMVNGVPLGLGGAEGHSVTEYLGQPCTPGICRNNGTCLPLLNTFTCLCPTPWSGTLCDRAPVDIVPEVVAVRFDGDRFYRYPRKSVRQRRKRRRSNKRANRIEAVVRSGVANGAVVVSKAGGLPWALLVHDSRPQLSVVTKRQHITLTSKVKIDDGQWHHVVAVKRRRALVLQVDQEPMIKLPLKNNHMATSTQFWIGGGSEKMPGGLPEAYYGRFKGCLRALAIDRRSVDLQELMAPARTSTNHRHRAQVPTCGEPR